MENVSKIYFGKYETASVLANVFIVKIFLGLPSELARAAGTAGWLVSLFSAVIFFGILFVIFKIYEGNENLDILNLAEGAFGKAFKIIFAIILSISFLVKGALALRVTSEIIAVVLPFDIPVTVCLFLFTLAGFVCAWKGLEGVVRIHALFLPFILAAFLFAVIAAFTGANTTNLFPFLGHGYKNIIENSLKYIGIYSDLIYIFLLAPYVKNKKIYKRACFSGVCVAGLVITVVVLSYSLSVPYPESTKLLMPIYQVSRLASIGANSQGFEAFLLPEWIISSLLYISLSTYFAAGILKKVTKIKRDKIYVILSAIFIYLLALIPQSLQEASKIGISYVNIFVILVSAASILISLIVRLKRRKVCLEK